MNTNKKEVMAVIGAGDMGHGICEVIALAGIPVYLYDINNDLVNRGMKRINESLDKLLERERISKEVYIKSKECLMPTIDIKEVAENARFIIEAVPEILEIKHSVFKELDSLTSPDTILATNTSNMSISEIAKITKHPERVVGVHFFNPVVLMELVEVIKGEKTSDEVMDTAYNLCKTLNKTPVRVEKDSPSFIVNRINAPVRTYLGTIVDNGYAKPVEIDALLKYHGHPMGHFELSDFVGLDVLYDSCKYREENLHHEYGPYQLLAEKVNNKKLGRKTGEGFYDWSNGRPTIDLDERTDVLEILDLDIIKYNEATKLIESGVATGEDIDLAMELGTGDKEGPVKACQNLNKEEIVQRLNELSEKYNIEALKPTNYIRNEVNING